MRCLRCFRDNGFLVHGTCWQCAPELHAQHNTRMKVVSDMDDAFLAATGKRSLEDWYAFEEFVESPKLPMSVKQAFIDAFREGAAEYE